LFFHDFPNEELQTVVVIVVSILFRVFPAFQGEGKGERE
jgi:hypothetical protein